MKYYDFEAVINLIKEGRFGAYLLYSNVGGELLGSSHNRDTKEDEIETETLIEDLKYKVDLMGYGNYKVIVKRSNKTQNANGVVYRFEIKPDSQPGQSQMNGFGSLDSMETTIEKRVNEKLELLKADLLRQQEINDLKRQIEELKNGGGGKGIEALTEIGKMGLGFIIAKTAPEAMPAINAMLGNVPEGQEMPKPTAFKRTD